MTIERDIDILIAEKIMGLNVVSKNHPCGYDPECGYYEASHFLPPSSWYSEEGPVYLPEDGVYPPVPEPEPRMSKLNYYCYVVAVPFYSTDISKTWEAVEKLSERLNGDISVSLFQRKSFYPQWRCRVCRDSPKYFDAWEKTAPLAICRSLLLAIEG
jgi:hypothetical protein